MNGAPITMDNDDYISMMKGYIDTAKGVIQLAVASLMLPVLFLRKIAGVGDGEPISSHITCALIWSWVFLLASVGLGLIYQIIASNRIEQKLDGTWKSSRLPSYCFRAMALSFFVGVSVFMFWAGYELK